MTDCGARTAVENSSVDTAGARALARRIAEGKPSPDGTPDLAGRLLGTGDGADEDVVYVRPKVTGAMRQVRIFVLGVDGRLRRVR